jgi:hypothetical protein
MKYILTERDKFYILTHYNTQSLGRKSQQLGGIYRQTIFYFHKRWMQPETIKNISPCGRPEAKMTLRTSKKIENYVKK